MQHSHRDMEGDILCAQPNTGSNPVCSSKITVRIADSTARRTHDNAVGGDEERGFESLTVTKESSLKYAGVAKLVAASDLGSDAFGRGGSSPFTRTRRIEEDLPSA